MSYSVSARTILFGWLIILLTVSDAGAITPKKPSDIRTLRNDPVAAVACPTGPGSVIDVQMNGDGTVSPFTIPEGRVFIVTGWQFAEGETGSEATLYISAPSPVGFSTSQSVTGDSHIQLSPGVIIKAGSSLCYFSDSATIVFVNVYGFIASDK